MKLEVSEGTLRNWERGRTPYVASYPKIIAFLETDPWPEPTTLPQKLHAARCRRGLSIAQAGALLGVDPSTIWWWEAGRRPHLLEHRRRIAAFIVAEAVTVEDGSCVAAELGEEVGAQSLGQMLRQHRRVQEFTLEDAARSLRVSPWTLMSWEHDRRIPTARYYPALIGFLGREPWPVLSTFAEKLRVARLKLGLSQRQAAVVMQVSPDSISDWESGHAPRHHSSMAKIAAFIAGEVRPRRRSRR